MEEVDEDLQEAASGNEEAKEDVTERQSRQIFVKNLNFETREEQLQ